MRTRDRLVWTTFASNAEIDNDAEEIDPYLHTSVGRSLRVHLPAPSPSKRYTLFIQMHHHQRRQK